MAMTVRSIDPGFAAVVEHPAHLRHLSGHAIDRFAGVAAEVDLQVVLGQFLGALESPSVAIVDKFDTCPNPAVERIRRQAVDMRTKILIAGDVADDADNPGVGGGHVEHPMVVVEPDAGSRHHRPRDPEGRGYFAVMFGQHRPVDQLSSGPGHGTPCGREGS